MTGRCVCGWCGEVLPDARSSEDHHPCEGQRVERANDRAREALAFLLVRIGSWTTARWDQHVRDEYGDEVADTLRGLLVKMDIPVDAYANSKVSEGGTEHDAAVERTGLCRGTESVANEPQPSEVTRGKDRIHPLKDRTEHTDRPLDGDGERLPDGVTAGETAQIIEYLIEAVERVTPSPDPHDPAEMSGDFYLGENIKRAKAVVVMLQGLPDTDEASAAELFRFIGVPFTDEAKRCMAKYTDGVRRRASLLFVPNATYRGATVIERLTVKP